MIRLKAEPAGFGQGVFEQPPAEALAAIVPVQVHLSQFADARLHRIQAIGADDGAVLLFEHVEDAAAFEVGLLDVTRSASVQAGSGLRRYSARTVKTRFRTGSQSAFVAGLNLGHVVIAS